MQAIKHSLQEYHHVSQQMADFKAAFKLYVNRKPHLSEDECIAGQQEDLTIAPLYLKEDMRGPTTLSWLLRDYLV